MGLHALKPLQAGCELHLGVKPNFAVDVTLTLTLGRAAAAKCILMSIIYGYILYLTRSLGALRAPTSSLWPFGPALGPSGLLDFVLRALRAFRPCKIELKAKATTGIKSESKSER